MKKTKKIKKCDSCHANKPTWHLCNKCYDILVRDKHRLSNNCDFDNFRIGPCQPLDRDERRALPGYDEETFWK